MAWEYLKGIGSDPKVSPGPEVTVSTKDNQSQDVRV